MKRVTVHPGKVFGRLTVIEEAGRGKSGHVLLRCKCNCGNIVVVTSSALRCKHHTQSCGCLNTETRSRIGKANRRHGHTWNVNGKTGSTPEYAAYKAAKERCTNPKHKQWKDYGGRFIKFDFKSFEEFYAALGPKPEPKYLYSLNRKDNDGPYDASNAEWAIQKTQVRNRRNTVLSEEKVAQIRQKYLSGVTQTELAKEFGVCPSTISFVVRNIGWKRLLDDDAVACVKRIGNKISSRDLAEAFRVSPSTIEKVLSSEAQGVAV